jgi:hypothetical protein
MMMKKMNVVLATAFAAAVMMQGAMAQQGIPAKDDLFTGTEVFAKNATDVTEITMNPDSLDRVGGNHAGRARQELLHIVREYTYDKPGMYDMAEVEKYRTKLDTGDWRCTVHERHLKTGSSTDVCAKRRTDDLKETAIIEVEPKELTFIHMIVKNGPDDHSEVGGMWMGSMAGLTSLATLDPDMISLKYQLEGLKYELGYGAGYGMSHSLNLNHNLNYGVAPMVLDLSVAPKIDSDGLSKSIQKSIEKSQIMKDKVKEFTTPDGEHTIVISPDVVIAPDDHMAPQAAPAPPAAPAPEPQPAPLPR